MMKGSVPTRTGSVEAARAAIEATALADVEEAAHARLRAELQPERLTQLIEDNAYLREELQVCSNQLWGSSQSCPQCAWGQAERLSMAFPEDMPIREHPPWCSLKVAWWDALWIACS